MNAEQGIAEARKAVKAKVQQAHSETLKRGVEIAQKESSGPLTTAMLRKLGHPYAKRLPAQASDSVINEQTGAFKRDWRAVPGQWSGKRLEGKIINANRVADFLKDGTKLMRLRPIDAEVERQLRPVAEENMRNEL